MKINIFENIPTLNNLANIAWVNNTLSLVGVVLPGTISFNTVAMILNLSSTNSEQTISINFGLYSLNGSTLSLANSASYSTSLSSNQSSVGFYATFATSATQNINPGNWYFGLLPTGTNTGGAARAFNNSRPLTFSGGIYVGVLVRGYLSVSTNALPASIATSDVNKEGSSANGQVYPYILISA